jgi:hypothetical protein
MIRKRVPIAERFLSKVTPEPNTGCWLWTGALAGGGYGYLGRGGQGAGNVQAHRASWEIHNGPIPDGLWVLHRCDNRQCVSPAHLFLGTQSDNMRDMVGKGRAASAETKARGERNAAAKLTAEQVTEIRAACAAGGRGIRTALALKYGVCRTTITYAARGDTWAHAKE